MKKKMQRLYKYKIDFVYDGIGKAVVYAENKERAKEVFLSGNYQNINDDSRNYVVVNVKK